ncbi:MAG: hypothetical protein ACR2QF_00190 [Geminicoccaceae bacterium]
MNSDDDATPEALEDRIKALSVRLAEARRTSIKSDVLNLSDICPELEDCARKIADLSSVEYERTKSLLLALLDEVNQTIESFQDEMGRMRRQLTSSGQSRAVDAAYRQSQKF